MTPVGRILIVDAHNNPVATALWEVPDCLRTPTVLSTYGMLHAVRQECGRWTYRIDAARGDRPADPELVGYRTPTDPDWDGPVPTVHMADFLDVKNGFNDLLSKRNLRDGGMVSAARVFDLFTLVCEAWPK